MPESPPFVSPKIRWSGLVDAGLFIGLAASWLGLFGRYHWLLDLCSHFRWQGTVVCLVALAWAAWRKRRLVLTAAIATLLMNAAWWASPGWSAPSGKGKAAPDFHVKVISFNVLTSNENHAGVLNWLQQTDADIIFLMEVDRVWAKALQPLLTTHPHHLIQPSSDNFGLALYSRIPFESSKILAGDELPLPDTVESELCMDSVEARFKIGGREWLFLGTHPVPPMGGLYASARDAQLQDLSRHLAQSGLPVLVAGDLNASPWSHGFRQLTSETALAPAPGAWKPTWRTGSLFGIPIDHALASLPLLFKSRTIGPDLGSDHRPQVLELGWEEGE